MLHIRHSFMDGTVIDGTERGDGSAPILKSLGWRWGRQLGMWFVPRSREHQAGRAGIEAARAALEASGFEIDVTIDDATPAAAEVEAAREVRQRDRAEALAARAERARELADQAFESAHAAIGRLPEGGEPIHVGHHSEGRHRAAIARAQRATSKALDARRDQKAAESRAAAAAHASGARRAPATVANRIRRLEADVRAAERDVAREVTGTRAGTPEWVERRRGDLEQLRDELDYWRGVRAEQVASGVAAGIGPGDLHRGDQVRIRQTWREVLRVNPTTVTVAGQFGRGRVPYSEIQERRDGQSATPEIQE